MASVGGQALIEGVMMQNGGRVAVAVRRTNDGQIVVRDLPTSKRLRKLGEIPFVRGLFRLYDMLSLGIRALNMSARIAFPDQEEEMSSGWSVLMIGLAVVIAVGAFVVLPLYIVNSVPSLREGSSIVFNLVEGAIRIIFFLAYIFVIARMKDIHRVFQYHGAEHKTVYTYEAGEELTVENARKYTTLHPRCGTAFLMIVLIISILIFSLAGNPVLWLKILSRLLLLPIVAGISYEVLRFSGKEYDNHWLVRLLVKPGLWLQKLTTAEPTDDMLEVAIASIKRVTEDPIAPVQQAMPVEEMS
ncbi:DUF1385 domain-containing protein [Candidatus Bipolaricaulota bacterium]|nr:DUF1385 domain-containing protein [Candidatus Bipolaricaulota bacterium]HHR85536.1 DUF1385 domain-containing protein [Candidatus Acetothermia bacterium]